VLDAQRALCERGHSFDRARSGYWNLLQPQDRRSLAAGDAREVALARRRLYERGLQAPLATALIDALGARGVARGAAALDLGCGEGSLSSEVARALGLDLVGLDLSGPAIELAARRAPEHTWVVANGDRRLPFPDGELALALSITGRRSRDELARVLAPGGWLALALPAPDDLAELRAALAGQAHALAPARAVEDELAGAFALEHARSVRATLVFDAEGIADLCRISYRGARSREQERLAGVTQLEVSASWRVHLLRRASHSAIP
jgi:23S rRNA (guanine745-N1)-methyltransferase